MQLQQDVRLLCKCMATCHKHLNTVAKFGVLPSPYLPRRSLDAALGRRFKALLAVADALVKVVGAAESIRKGELRRSFESFESQVEFGGD